MPRTIRVHASTYQNASDLIDAQDQFEQLLGELVGEAFRFRAPKILWDTMMLGSEEVSYDSSTLLEPQVESYTIWSANVLAVCEEEE